MGKELHGLVTWAAPNSAGEPICIASARDGQAVDEGMSLSLYLHEEDGLVEIRGVEVCEGLQIVARHGWLPGAVLDEELE